MVHSVVGHGREPTRQKSNSLDTVNGGDVADVLQHNGEGGGESGGLRVICLHGDGGRGNVKWNGME